MFVEASLQIFFIIPYYTTIRTLSEFEAGFIVDVPLKTIRVFKIIPAIRASVVKAGDFLARETWTMT